MPYREGQKVDPSDVMSDGERFENVDQFKQLLLRDKRQLAQALTTKLMTYATGRAPTKADRLEIDAIVARLPGKNYGFRSLVHEVVQSGLFQTK